MQWYQQHLTLFLAGAIALPDGVRGVRHPHRRVRGLEGTIHGDLEGVGRWHFNNEGAVSVVRYEWYVRSTRWWMNLIARLLARCSSVITRSS